MRAERLTLFSAPSAKLTSRAGETERDFRLRLAQAARESRDAAVEKLRASYAAKSRAARRSASQTAEEGVSREQDQASQQQTQTMVSFGATVLGALLGRKAVSGLDARPRHDGRPRRRPLGEGIAGRRAARRTSSTAAQEELKALEDELERGDRRADGAGPGSGGHRDHRGQAQARRRGRPPRGARLEAGRVTWTVPAAARAMQEQTLDGHVGRPVAIDVCLPCQSFWFDAHESLQLSPGGTLALFRLIGEHTGKRSFSNADLAKCPRCQARLRLTQDMQRTTRFSYLRCPNDHGRLTTFFDFLREKDFIRPLTPEQLQELRQNVQTVNCSNCGAPVDVTQRVGLRALRLAALDARHAAGGGARRAAAEGRRPRPPADRPGAAARACCAPGGRWKPAFPHDRGGGLVGRPTSSRPASRPSPAGSSGTRKG